MIASGVLLIVLLSLGVADPPRTGRLQWQVQSPYTWPEQHESAEIIFLKAPHDLPDAFTLELTATNDGPPDSAWGIQFTHAEPPVTILIDNQGYFSVSTNTQPIWAEFIHLAARQPNTLTLYIERKRATLRINDEVAWTGNFIPTHQWGIITYRQPDLQWHEITLYFQP